MIVVCVIPNEYETVVGMRRLFLWGNKDKKSSKHFDYLILFFIESFLYDGISFGTKTNGRNCFLL